MDFAGAMASAASALTIVKQLNDVDRSLSEGELKAKIASLYVSLADVKMALADAQQEIQAKDHQIAELKKRATTAKPMIELNGFQYEEVDGKANGLPFCPNCLLENIQIRPVTSLTGFQCPKCKSHYSQLRYAS
jgi:chromosome segregation ATPase